MTTIETVEMFKQQHKQWLHLEITKALNAALDKHITLVEDKLCGSSMDKDVPDEHIRRLVVQLATIKTTKKLINETETFVAKCNCN